MNNQAQLFQRAISHRPAYLLNLVPPYDLHENFCYGTTKTNSINAAEADIRSHNNIKDLMNVSKATPE